MAQIRNLYIDQGSTFAEDFCMELLPQFLDYDLSDLDVVSAIKKSSWSENVIAYFNYVYFPETKKIVLYLSHEETANLPVGRYEYDVLAHNSAKRNRFRVAEGIVTINPGISNF